MVNGSIIADLLRIGTDIGIFEFYLPFLILFSIFYGLLNKSKIFGDPKEVGSAKAVNAILSLAVAFYIMSFTFIGTAFISLTQFFSTFFTQTAVILVTLIVFVMIVFLLAGGGVKEQDITRIGTYIVVGGGLLALGIFISSGGTNIFPGGTSNLFISTQDLAIIALLVITGLVIYWLTRGEKSQ